ncbi:MAG: FtsX-like permease family protein, partial [Candidatus Zixiibacteriota bacterium]
ITVNDKYECRITGILKETPYNTQQHTNFIISYKTLEGKEEDINSWSREYTEHLYLIFPENADIAAVGAKIESIKNQYFPSEERPQYAMYLMPFNDLMFRGFPGAQGELNPRAEMEVIIYFAAIAGLILLMAIANFFNLSTAKASERTKEVGVRKVMGANRKDLIYQFLGESIILTVFATLLGVFIYEIFKAVLEPSLARPMMADIYNNVYMILGTIGIMIIVGIMAGSYPALYLSRFNPITVLQKKIGIKSSKSILRKAMVVFQFAIATMFVFVAYVIYQQVNLVMGTDLGYETKNILIVDFDGENLSDKAQLMKNEILSGGLALNATVINFAPGRKRNPGYLFYTTEERQREEAIVVKLFSTDYDFVLMENLEIVEGRNLLPDRPEDQTQSILVTESARDELQIDKLIGHRLYRKDGFFEIVGVVKNFHGSALNHSYNKVNIIRIKPDEARTLMVKLPADNITGSIASIHELWQKNFPGEEFTYSFLETEILETFEELRSMRAMFGFFCIGAIGIAALGILGLVTYTAQQRTKEIGIRKVMGASERNIVSLLSKEFIILIIIASGIGWPLAYIMAKDFISYYPIRTSIGIDVFLITAVISLIVAMMAAGSQAYKAARANPADIIRTE